MSMHAEPFPARYGHTMTERPEEIAMAQQQKRNAPRKADRTEPVPQVKPMPFPGESPTVSLAMAAARMYGMHEEEAKPAKPQARKRAAAKKKPAAKAAPKRRTAAKRPSRGASGK